MFSLIVNASTQLSPKWLSLIGFIIQNSLVIIILKLSTIYSYIGDIHHHIISTTVVSTEILKFVLSSFMCYALDSNFNSIKFRQIIFDAFTEDGADCLKLCVPAILYTIQNNLQYIIEEAPLFLVLYHSKIITTAIFYSTMLARRLTSKEWLCIGLLAIGVSMVESSQVEIVPHHASDVIGILSVITACLTSGFAGVYFERILKSSRSSIWVINMQMSLLSAFISMSVTLIQDSVEIAHEGFFTGYNRLTILSIVLQAIFGLAVALVVKYADNIFKGFGHSLSVILCNTLSAFIFEDTLINETFLLGCFLVIISSTAYTNIHLHMQLILPTQTNISASVLNNGHKYHTTNNTGSSNNMLIKQVHHQTNKNRGLRTVAISTSLSQDTTAAAATTVLTMNEKIHEQEIAVSINDKSADEYDITPPVTNDNNNSIPIHTIVDRVTTM